MKTLLLNSLLATLLATAAIAQSPTPTPAPPSAPLPAALATAHKLFLGNAGDQDNAECVRAYNDFYAGLTSLHRFELVTDPAQADLILELHYEFSFGLGVEGNSIAPRQFRVLFIEPVHHVILWSLTERSNYAVRKKNRDKDLDQTVSALVNDVDLLTQPTSIAPHNNSVAHH